MKCRCSQKFAGDQNQAYCSVMKTLLLKDWKEQTWGRL